jgi:hypothetical protein
MIPHDILTLYTAKMVEYGIAVLFIVLFVPFWRLLYGSPKRAEAPARAAARSAVLVPQASRRVPVRTITEEEVRA